MSRRRVESGLEILNWIYSIYVALIFSFLAKREEGVEGASASFLLNFPVYFYY